MPSFLFTTLFSVLCTAALIPPAHSFGFGFSKQHSRSIAPSIVPVDFKSDPLADSLARFSFPSNTHDNPAYASVLAYLSSLESKPSCHRTATASLISDCNSLSESSDDADLRYRYAAQLAVCEFEATGVRYPAECKGLSGKGGHKRCIKRLEERPQWWTTLSNNIQNAMMVCVAVRHEVEQDRLLDLHRNITKVQEQLFKVMDTSLNQVQGLREEQVEFEGGWKGFLRHVTQDVEDFQQRIMDRLRVGAMNLDGAFSKLMERVDDAQVQSKNGILELNTVLRKANEDSILWSEKTREAWESADQMISQASTEQHRGLSNVVHTIEEINTLLKATAEKSVQSLDETAESLSVALTNAVVTANDLSALSILYTSLLSTHEAMLRTQEAAESRQQELLTTIAKLEPRINGMASTLLLSAEKIEKSLDDAETRLQSMGGMWNKNAAALILMALSAALWFGRENWRGALGIAGLMTSAYMWWSANPQLHRLPGWASNYESIGRDVSIARAMATTSIQSTHPTAILLVLLPILAIVAAVFTVWMRLSTPSRHRNRDEKLPA